MCIVNIFSLLTFHVLTLPFEEQKFLILVKLNLPFFPFIVCAFVWYLQHLCPIKGGEDFVLFFSRDLLVLVSTFRFMIHFNLVSVYGMRSVLKFTLFHRDIQSFSAFCCKDDCFPHWINYLGNLIENQLTGCVWSVSGVCFVPFIYMFTLMLIPHFILVTMSQGQSGNHVVQVFPLCLSS